MCYFRGNTLSIKYINRKQTIISYVRPILCPLIPQICICFTLSEWACNNAYFHFSTNKANTFIFEGTRLKMSANYTESLATVSFSLHFPPNQSCVYNNMQPSVSQV